jgi:hypothetical protein
LVLWVLVDSASTRSLISLALFKRMQLVDPRLCFTPVSLNCLTASREELHILG